MSSSRSCWLPSDRRPASPKPAASGLAAVSVGPAGVVAGAAAAAAATEAWDGACGPALWIAYVGLVSGSSS